METIKENLEADKSYDKAYDSLENLLELGPKNTNALKLKAQLLSSEGKFQEEGEVWKLILSLDPEDEDAMEYYENTLIQQREHEFFSDLLPSGGIRFLANPRAMATASFLGVLGCGVFLTLANFSKQFPILASKTFSYAFFIGFVILPWLFIVYIYFRCVKDITIDRQGVLIRTRLKEVKMQWLDLKNFYLVRGEGKEEHKLFILLEPKNQNKSAIMINISGNGIVRAPTFLVREIVKKFQNPQYTSMGKMNFEKKPITFC